MVWTVWPEGYYFCNGFIHSFHEVVGVFGIFILRVGSLDAFALDVCVFGVGFSGMQASYICVLEVLVFGVSIGRASVRGMWLNSTRVRTLS